MKWVNKLYAYVQLVLLFCCIPKSINEKALITTFYKLISKQYYLRCVVFKYCASCNLRGVQPQYLFYFLQVSRKEFINLAKGDEQLNILAEKIVA